MNFRSLYKKIDTGVHIYARRKLVKSTEKRYFKMLDEHSISIKRLTSEQKDQVKQVWGDLFAGKDFSTYELALSVTGKFDPYICSELVFRTNLELQLNNFQLKWGWSDKNYFDMFFSDVPMPSVGTIRCTATTHKDTLTLWTTIPAQPATKTSSPHAITWRQTVPI